MAKSEIRAGHYAPVMRTGRLRIMQIRVRLELKWFFSYKESHIINNLITSTVRSLRENLKPRPSRVDLAIARSIRQGLRLRFSRNDLTLGYQVVSIEDEMVKIYIHALDCHSHHLHHKPVNKTRPI